MLVLRDVIFGNRRRFRELLQGSEEGVASNSVSSRLKRLVAASFGPPRSSAISVTAATGNRLTRRDTPGAEVRGTSKAPGRRYLTSCALRLRYTAACGLALE